MTALIFWKDQEMDRLRRDIDRIFRRCCRDLRVSMTPFVSDRPLPMDLAETDEALVLTAALPGIRRENMTILVSEDTLTIEAKRTDQTLDETSDARQVMDQATTLFRKIHLSRSADIDQIEASFKDDILTIIIPKLKPTRKQGITIQVG